MSETDKRPFRIPEYNAERGEQRTICEECGNSNLAHARAVWTLDGSSYCPPCSRPSPSTQENEG